MHRERESGGTCLDWGCIQTKSQQPQREIPSRQTAFLSGLCVRPFPPAKPRFLSGLRVRPFPPAKPRSSAASA
jgi:hypothetical protein